MSFIVATYVSASSQGQRTHSARTKIHGAFCVASYNALVKHLHYFRGKTSKLEENYIYGTIEQQEIIANIYSDILEVRGNLQQQLNQSKVT